MYDNVIKTCKLQNSYDVHNAILLYDCVEQLFQFKGKLYFFI